jgi:hypothetical protein
MIGRNLIILAVLSFFSVKAFSEATYKCLAESYNGGKKVEVVYFHFPNSDDELVHSGATVEIHWQSGAEKTVIGVDEKLIYRFEGKGFSVNRGTYFDTEVLPVEGSPWLRGLMARKATWMYTIECLKE